MGQVYVLGAGFSKTCDIATDYEMLDVLNQLLPKTKDKSGTIGTCIDALREQNVREQHGVSFEIARHVFDDPDAFSDHDRIEGGERRWQTLGMVDRVLLLLVAHTVELEGADETIRIISARRADAKERQRYEKERQKNRGW